MLKAVSLIIGVVCCEPLIDTVCIKPTEELGPTLVARLETDKSNFLLMSLVEKEYSVPWEMTICHDEERIHGMQLTLKMHRDEELELTSDYLEKIDQLIKDSEPRRMELVGSNSEKCETLFIYAAKHELANIKVFWDDSGVRALEFYMSDLQKYSYGLKASKDRYEGHESEIIDFSDRNQLLGLFGKVEVDETGDSPDKLLTLGFFKDECSITATGHWSGFYEEEFELEKQTVALESARFFFIIFIVIGTLGVIFLLYCCLKNRGTICKKKSKDTGIEIQQ